MTITFPEFLDNGGGNLHYLVHFAGYPFGVASSPALKAALDADTTARRKIFGYARHWNGATHDYFADDVDVCPILVGLEDVGIQSWKLKESKGRIDGGDFSITVADQDYGQDWYHSSTDFRGLEGVHRVVQPRRDETVGYGFISQSFLPDDQFIYCHEKSKNTILEDGITGDSNDRRLLWIGQECIAVEDANIVDGELKIELSVSNPGYARGLFRSREQGFYTEAFRRGKIGSPVVSDAPMSIIDKPCFVWGIVLDEISGDIVCGPVQIRWGTVGTRVESKRGKTTISVLSPFSQIDTDVEIPRWDAGLRKYVFYRHNTAIGGIGDDDGDLGDTSEVFLKEQCPHLVLKTISRARQEGINHYIWICDQNEERTFDTVLGVIDALNEELAACANGNTSQRSFKGAHIGGGRLVNVGFTVRVEMLRPSSWEFYFRGDLGPMAFTTELDYGGEETDIIHMVASGPLAWLFNISPVSEKTRTNDLIDHPTYGHTGPKPWFLFAQHVIHGQDNALSGHDPDSSQAWKNTPWKAVLDMNFTVQGIGWTNPTIERVADYYGDLLGESGYNAKYYYEFQWASQDVGNFEPIGGTPLDGHSSTFKYLPIGGTLYIDPDDPVDGIAPADTIILGSPDDRHTPPRFAQATISAGGVTKDDNDYGEILVGNTITNVDDNPTPFYYGVGLFYIPAAEAKHYDDIEKDKSGNLLYPNDLDPWRLGQAFSMTSHKLSEIFREMMGETTNLQLPESMKLRQIVGFTEINRPGGDDYYSMIDWDQLDNFAPRVVGSQHYKLNLVDKFNLYEMLTQELVFHGLAPTLEWGYDEDQFVVRFKKIGVVNATAAQFGGRLLTEKMIKTREVPTTRHNDTRMYNRMKVEVDYNEATKSFPPPINVEILSGHAANRSDSRELSIKAMLTHMKGWENLDKTEQGRMSAHLLSILRVFNEPQPEYSTKAGLNALLNIALGRECLITDRSGRVPWSHEYGLSGEAALVTQMRIDLKRNSVRISARLAPDVTYGWAPSVHIGADDSSKSGPATVNVTATTAHAFSAANERTDVSWFDDYTWNESTQVYTNVAATAGLYRVYAFEVMPDGSTDPTLMEFRVSAVNPTANTMQLVDEDGGFANFAAWDTTKEHVCIYVKYDHANIQARQKQFVFFADKENNLTGGDAARRWF